MDSAQKKMETTLSLTENHSIKLISKVEEDVSLQMLILQEKLIPLQEAEQMYMELKREYDELSRELEDNKLLLETLVRFKNDIKENKDIRIMRASSHLERKDGRSKQQRNFKWIRMCIEVLESNDRFMTGEDIFKQVLKANPLIEEHFSHNKTKLNQLRLNTIHNINRACSETRRNNSGKLIDYYHKIGLFSWVDDQFVPDARYIKEFIHGNQDPARDNKHKHLVNL